MPTLPLPESPSLEMLQRLAEDLREAVRAGDAAALREVRERHPHAASTARELSQADALFVVARRYGFESWESLERHLDVVARFLFDPRAAAGSEPAEDAFVRLACLDYGSWHPASLGEARRVLAESPGLTRASIWSAAAAGDAAAVSEMLARDRGLVNARGGPHGWEPLLYACYSRLDVGDLPGSSTLAAARLLVAAGADANAGFLWRGNVPPFTALTGAFGDGEGGNTQPSHPHRDALARLLLDAGADPNDGQTLYNRHFRADDAHLEILFSYGLGTDRGGPWYARLGARLDSPSRLLVEELWSAARKGFFDRVRLLVAHGADVDAAGKRDGRTPHEAAMLAGHDEIAEYLVAHGATRAPLSRDDRFASACVAGRRDEAVALLAEDPSLLDRLGRHGRVRLVHRAVEGRRLDGVRLMAELGFEMSEATSHDGVGINLAATPLHNAAWMGDLDMVRLLLSLGADPAALDPSYRATPLGWAEYNRQADVVAYLSTVGKS